MASLLLSAISAGKQRDYLFGNALAPVLMGQAGTFYEVDAASRTICGSARYHLAVQYFRETVLMSFHTGEGSGAPRHDDLFIIPMSSEESDQTNGIPGNSVGVHEKASTASRRRAIKQLDGCKLFLLRYSFGEYSVAPFVNSVCTGVVLGSDHFVEATVNELNRAVVFDSDADAAGSEDHVSEVFPSRHSPCPTVVMGAVDSLDEAKTSYLDVIPISRIIERHRIRMSRIKPADGACTDARKHSSILIDAS